MTSRFKAASDGSIERKHKPANILTMLSPRLGSAFGSRDRGDAEDVSESAWNDILSAQEGSRDDKEQSTSLLFDRPLSAEPSALNEADGLSQSLKSSSGKISQSSGKSRIRIQYTAVSNDSSDLSDDSAEDDEKHRGFKLPGLSQTHKDIIKCGLAYFIASLFTYNNRLSELVGLPFDEDGPVSNAHFIATVAVYYNPAKAMGNMVEANLFVLWSSLFSLCVCCASMATAVVLNQGGYEWLSHTVIVGLFLTGSSGYIAYMKNKVGKATFGSACSMAALIVSVIIVKEGAVHLGRFETDAILQMLYIVIIGALISNVVCVFVWRVSATSLLQANITKTLDSFATLTALLSNTFLLEEDPRTTQDQLKRAVAAHEASFNSLKASLEDAKLELFDPRIQRRILIYDDLVKSMTRLAQHLTGLRSGCLHQSRVLQARKIKRYSLKKGHAAIDMSNAKDDFGPEATVFLAFKQLVGPSLVALADSCRSGLKESRIALSQPSSIGTRKTLPDLQQRIEQARKAFSEAHADALRRLYRSKTTTADAGNRLGFTSLNNTALRSHTQFESDSESIFTVYFFLFNLEEFASEMLTLLPLVANLGKQEISLTLRQTTLSRKYGSFLGRLLCSVDFAPSTRDTRPHRLNTLFARLTTLSPRSKSERLFPKNQNAAESSHPADISTMSSLQRFSYFFWRSSLRLRTDDMKFAIKTGVGAGLLGLPAFIDSTRPTWVKYRGEWAMISYMVVVATTAAQSNFNAFFRIAGTLLGATVAVGAYHLSHANPIILSIFGFFFSLPNFWLIVTRPKWATTGRFILLAYNLTALYAYNKREDDLHVGYIAFRRSIAVCIGSLWGWFIATCIWPYEARRELRRGLAELFLNSAYLYKRLIQAYSKPPASYVSLDTLNSPDETTSLLSLAARKDLDKEIQTFASMELALQRRLIKLNGLLGQTKYEPRSKGPFPVSEYRQILQASQAILDQLHALRCVTTREEWYSSVRKDFVLPVQDLRREMVGNVLLYFSLLASLISLKSPAPLYMPPANRARERLVAAIRELDVVKRRKVKNSSTYLLYYAYSLSIKDLIDQLDRIGLLLRQLFGVLGGSPDEFEAMFIKPDVCDLSNTTSGNTSGSD